MTTYPSKTYAFKKADILRVFRDIDPNFSLDLPSITEPKAEPQQSNDLPNFLYLKPLLTINEAACIISKDSPSHESAARNHMSDDDYFNNFQSYIEARDFVDSAIEAEELQHINYKIKKTDFALFLRTHNIIRQGFNDNLSPEPINNFGTPTIASTPSLDNHYRQLSEKQQAEITQLKARIAELENQQSSIQEKELHSRTANNAAKIIAALSSLAKVGLAQPYATYAGVKAQGELLGLDMPSDDTFKKWAEQATALMNNPN